MKTEASDFTAMSFSAHGSTPPSFSIDFNLEPAVNEKRIGVMINVTQVATLIPKTILTAKGVQTLLMPPNPKARGMRLVVDSVAQMSGQERLIVVGGTVGERLMLIDGLKE